MGAADTVDTVVEEAAVGEVEDEVANDTTIIKWQGTMILTSSQKQRFMILIYTDYSRENRRAK